MRFLLPSFNIISHGLGGEIHVIKMVTDFLNSPLLWLFILDQSVPKITRGCCKHFGISLWPFKGFWMCCNSIYSHGISLDFYLGPQTIFFFSPPFSRKINSIAVAIVWIGRVTRWTFWSVWRPERAHSDQGNAAEHIKGGGPYWTK